MPTLDNIVATKAILAKYNFHFQKKFGQNFMISRAARDKVLFYINIKEGDSVGIIGIGPIGLMFAKYAKLKGARVIVGGRNPLKLKMN